MNTPEDKLAVLMSIAEVWKKYPEQEIGDILWQICKAEEGPFKVFFQTNEEWMRKANLVTEKYGRPAYEVYNG